MINLSEKLGDMEYDGLLTGIAPPAIVGGGTIRKLSAETTLVRGTVLAASDTDGKLVVLGTAADSGETLTPDSILCDDITVGTTDDEPTSVYIAGCFDPDKVTVADGYTMTAADLDALRVRSIIFKAAQ